MGLDMFARSVPKELLRETDSDIDFEAHKVSTEIWYWRKHPNLHGWMEQLYRTKGGIGEFNCKALRLTERDLMKLEKDLQDRALPVTSGFFFGESNDEQIAGDLEFVKKAKEELAQGNMVYYDSWW